MPWSVTPTRPPLGLRGGLLNSSSSARSLHLEGDVLHPGRRVGVAAHGRLRGQLKEGQHIALPCVEENVHVRVRRSWCWAPGLPAMASTKSMCSIFWYQSTVSLASLQRYGHVVDAFYSSWGLLGSSCWLMQLPVRHGAPGRAPAIEQGLEVAFAETFIALRWMNSKNTGPSRVARRSAAAGARLTALR